MSQYYYEVAGLPDIAPDDVKVSLGYEEYLSELMTALSGRDARLLGYFRCKYENTNLISWLRDKESPMHPLGLIAPETFANQLQAVGCDDMTPLAGVPAYMLEFMREIDEGTVSRNEWENRLTALFYDYAAASRNAFVRDWFAFEQNLSNVQVALSCRKYGLDIETQIVGDNEVCQALRTSTARDFGLSELFPQVETLLRIGEDADLLSRERKVDQIKWDYLSDACIGHEFSVEALLSYLVRLQSIERWMHLDPKQGEEMFRTLISTLKENVRIPEE